MPERGIAVRMNTVLHECEWFAENSHRIPEDVGARIMDQLWLRTVLIEQRRRMRVTERDAFDQRADRMLAALDPQESPA